MSLVNESLLEKLPAGVLDMMEANYKITYLVEENNSIVCKMEIGSDWNRGLNWTISVDGSDTFRIQLTLMGGLDDSFRDSLLEYVEVDDRLADVTVYKFADRFNTLKNVFESSGCNFVLYDNDRDTIFEYWDVVLDVNVSSEVLIKMAMEVDNFSEYATNELEAIGITYF